jgi:hypothetical protein
MLEKGKSIMKYGILSNPATITMIRSRGTKKFIIASMEDIFLYIKIIPRSSRLIDAQLINNTAKTMINIII